LAREDVPKVEAEAPYRFRAEVPMRRCDAGFVRRRCWNIEGEPRPGPPSQEVVLMTIEMFILCIAIGSAVIALWLDVRFPKLMPGDLKKMLVHIVAAFLVVYAVPPVMDAVARAHVPSPNLASVFLVAFPVLIYEFLVGAWLIKLAQASGKGGFGFRS
jgi:hypothetical protein